MLDTWQLAQMRETQEDAFPDRVTVRRITYVDDSFGGVSTGIAVVVADDVPCRISPAQVQMLGGQASRQLEVEKWTVRFPVGSDIQDADIISWDSKDIQLQVETAKDAKSYQTAFTVQAEVVRSMNWQTGVWSYSDGFSDGYEIKF